ncbi:hypothetical protein BAUCODRAFT_425672 [Baudoinia panamericana UAMH 10762]|uniref:Extracellular membrane protein CFEM domain-containing protein n=1 Tax=Baudoinia panamericana (strain UAMH 10762) TaxID=717646 RepID=M2NGI0_BAUPA|nr:uncharacterized protein BAUCODRAFT_425672 [Baudoinia panamericana UAMH 10762]EMC98419.1 hypothetical protein BAUCODRAFT_425672 [Baudoinia panamericana UAMH 10762]
MMRTISIISLFISLMMLTSPVSALAVVTDNTLIRPVTFLDAADKNGLTVCQISCWNKQVIGHGCTGSATLMTQNACMCGNGGYDAFMTCNSGCQNKSQASNRPSWMGCSHALDERLGAHPAGDVDVDMGKSTAAADPTTFITEVKRAPNPQIIALTPFRAAAAQAIPAVAAAHVSFPATIGPCGPPGATCNFVSDTSSTILPPSTVSMRNLTTLATSTKVSPATTTSSSSLAPLPAYVIPPPAEKRQWDACVGPDGIAEECLEPRSAAKRQWDACVGSDGIVEECWEGSTATKRDAPVIDELQWVACVGLNGVIEKCFEPSTAGKRDASITTFPYGKREWDAYVGPSGIIEECWETPTVEKRQLSLCANPDGSTYECKLCTGAFGILYLC